MHFFISVRGTRVSEAEASEVIVRTQDWWVSSADHEYLCSLYDLLGIDYSQLETGFPIPSIGTTQLAQDRYGCLNLRLLKNRRIGDRTGPYGWCGWDGHIGVEMLRLNLSEHAVIAEPNVYGEWYEIAEALPFLELECQLYGADNQEGEGVKLVMHYRIKDGKVTRMINNEEWEVDQKEKMKGECAELSDGGGVPIGELKIILSMLKVC